MSRWHEGQRAQVVEHVDATRQPKEDGAVYPAEVLKVAGPYVVAEMPLIGEVASFWVQSGWAAWDAMFRWRLMPLESERRALMGIFSREHPEGHPNARLYELFYEGGLQYVYRTPGREPVRQWNLASAVMMANLVTSQDQETVSVVDPATRTVLWVGEIR